MKGSKLAGSVVVVLAVSVMARADVASDMAAATKLYYDATKKAEAKAAYAKIIKDYPDAPVATLAACQWLIGHCADNDTDRIEAWSAVSKNYPAASPDLKLQAESSIAYVYYRQRKFDVMESTYRQAIANYSTASVDGLAKVQSLLAWTFDQRGMWKESESENSVVVSRYPTASNGILGQAYWLMGKAQLKQGKATEANASLVNAIVNLGRVPGNGKRLLDMFNMITPDNMTKDEFKSAMERIVKAVRPIPENIPVLELAGSEKNKKM
jgi:tetratricopeptide (TPR) repeat protein